MLCNRFSAFAEGIDEEHGAEEENEDFPCAIHDYLASKIS
jgi:hypothetical protein